MSFILLARSLALSTTMMCIGGSICQATFVQTQMASGYRPLDLPLAVDNKEDCIKHVPFPFVFFFKAAYSTVA